MPNAHALERISDSLPLLPLKDVVIFPQMILPIFVSEDICLRAIDEALSKDRFIFLSAFQSDLAGDSLGCPELKVSTQAPFDVYDIGTVATILRTRKLPDGRTKILIQGISRASIISLRHVEPYPRVQLRLHLEQDSEKNNLSENLFKTMKEQLEKVVTIRKSISPDVLMLLEDVDCIGKFADLVASHFGLKIVEAQKVLGTFDPVVRLHKVQALIMRELEQIPPKNTKDESFKNHKEFYLREQMKSIKNELGEMDGKDELEDIREKIVQAQMSEEANTECIKQLKRLERMNQDSSEASLTRTYLECMVELPWQKYSVSSIGMTHCKKVLDTDHYGLDKIKDRILEYIAVKKLNPQLKGPILCFVGPPGVGKTSLGKSIAKALGRKFARISLGGVRDEAEIRGHRRTYVGALPGRVIQALKTAGVKNPVLMLDEMDKLGSDYKGDPASALLEVLDPEQNHNFSDHYVAVPFDLSQVIFLANANRLDTIPPALRDRLEIIEISGYTEEEKSEITRQFIIPKIVEQSGLSTDLVQFHDNAVSLVIHSYTRESGLRSLEKNIAMIARKLARYYAENDEKGKVRKPVKVTAKVAKELLGEERYLSEEHNIHKKHVGIAVGLAYTQVGGEILELEVKLFKGNGKLTLTGQLGDVMKESAQTAFSCIRGLASELKIDPQKFAEFDVHLHVPQGAIPKDGPSAGIGIAMSLISAFRNEPLRQDIAMTGEVSLNGRVMPIGGVREKLLAALRNNITTVCLPEKNKGSFAELPITIKRKINVCFVSNILEVAEICFGNISNIKQNNHEILEENSLLKSVLEEGVGDEVNAA
ncbi:MAG: endopeptidase La [Bdellovibrionota bacterium]